MKTGTIIHDVLESVYLRINTLEDDYTASCSSHDKECKVELAYVNYVCTE